MAVVDVVLTIRFFSKKHPDVERRYGMGFLRALERFFLKKKIVFEN